MSRGAKNQGRGEEKRPLLSDPAEIIQDQVALRDSERLANDQWQRRGAERDEAVKIVQGWKNKIRDHEGNITTLTKQYSEWEETEQHGLKYGEESRAEQGATEKRRISTEREEIKDELRVLRTELKNAKREVERRESIMLAWGGAVNKSEVREKKALIMELIEKHGLR